MISLTSLYPWQIESLKPKHLYMTHPKSIKSCFRAICWIGMVLHFYSASQICGEASGGGARGAQWTFRVWLACEFLYFILVSENGISFLSFDQIVSHDHNCLHSEHRASVWCVGAQALQYPFNSMTRSDRAHQTLGSVHQWGVYKICYVCWIDWNDP